MSDSFDRVLFGQKLRAIRVSYGYTQARLSNLIGYSQNTISNWENGNREPETINDLLRIASFFKVDLSYFVDNNVKPINDWGSEFGIERDPNLYTDDLENLNDKQREILKLTNGLDGSELDEIIEFILGKSLLKEYYNK